MGRQKQKPKGKPKNYREAFVHRLHELGGHLTYQQIATIVGVRADTVAKWFQGANVPDIDHWPKLAKAMGVSVKELLPPNW